jgi:hypothetical protein
MSLGKRTFRTAAFAVVLALACAVPAMAMAVTIGDFENPEPLTLPVLHQEGTLVVLPGYGVPLHVYTFDLAAGQTVSATFTAAPAVEVFGWSVAEDPDVADFGTDSDYVDASTQHMTVMAPATGTLFLVAQSSNVGTFAVDASIVDTLTFTLGSLVVPSSAKHSKTFKVSAKVRSAYNGLKVPVRFYVEKKASNGKYKPYTSKPATSASGDNMGTYSKFSCKLSLSKKGTYRIRARFKDIVHSSIYTPKQTIKIK